MEEEAPPVWAQQRQPVAAPPALPTLLQPEEAQGWPGGCQLGSSSMFSPIWSSPT